MLVTYDRHEELAAAADLLCVATPWREAAHTLGEQCYADAATILDSIQSVPSEMPDEFFGKPAVISRGPRSATATALHKVETLGISTEQLDDLRAHRPAVDTVVVEALAVEIRRLATALTEALYVPSEKPLLRRVSDSWAFGSD